MFKATETNPHALAINSVRSAAGLEPIFAHEPGIIPENAATSTLTSGDKVYPTKHFLATDAFKMIDKDHLEGIPRALAEFFHDRFDRMAGDTPVVAVDRDIMREVNKRFKMSMTPRLFIPRMIMLLSCARI